MRRRIPSTSALVAFESAARHQSFTRAAQELSLTQSAVCRQIGSLEAQLGIKLFNRVKRRVTLSQAGQVYCRQVKQMLDRMERDTLEVAAHEGVGGIVELAVLPTMGARWLIPRLPDFYRSHPEITLNLSARVRPFLFADTQFDAAIYSGAPSFPGTRSDYLFGEDMVPVCSPKLLPRSRTAKARSLASLPLLHLATRPEAWGQWFAHVGVSDVVTIKGPRFEQFSMSIRAAIAGMGVALVPRFLAEEELQSGSLIVAVDIPVKSDRAYYLVSPDHKEEPTALQPFREWLLAKSAEYRGP